jgi:hypothetical protein
MMASLSEKEKKALKKRLKSIFSNPDLQRRLPLDGGKALRDTMEKLLNPSDLSVYDEIREMLRKEHQKAKTNGPPARFPTPPDATWDDVRIRFKDGHTVSIKVKSGKGVYTYADMGMVDKRNGKPNSQWELLRTFADEGGTLDWSSKRANRRNQKRREYLAANLRCFFDIEGDPFRLTRDRKGWEARFLILPDE